MSSREILVVNLSGRGDKDMGILARELNIPGANQAANAAEEL